MTEMAEAPAEVLKLYDGKEIKLFWERLAEDRRKFGSSGYALPNIRFGIGICKYCGRIFIKSSFWQKYCTWSCRNKFKRRRRKNLRPLSPYQLDFAFNYFVVHNKLSAEEFEKMLNRTKRYLQRKMRRLKQRGTPIPSRQIQLFQTVETKFKLWLKEQEKKKQG
ncbi:MAG: hypothetical protein DRP00_00850 [Candidatus Aenigmatarchaeota archaeon]|nr:MAG: hypothetical protein DRP00_00850 [Candidatus Aenigmarchaeota archaeon]